MRTTLNEPAIQEPFPRFSNTEYTRRYTAIREAMDRDGLDAILLSGARGSSEVRYLSNYLAQSPCWLLFPRREDPTLFIHFFNHQPCAQAQASSSTNRLGIVFTQQLTSTG
jgi:Creatinase/Prolidase N-terminal domain